MSLYILCYHHLLSKRFSWPNISSSMIWEREREREREREAKRLIGLCAGITRAQRASRANSFPHRVAWYSYGDDKLKEGCCRALLPEARRASTGTTGCCRFSCNQCSIVSALRSRSTMGFRSPLHHTKRGQRDLGSLQMKIFKFNSFNFLTLKYEGENYLLNM